MSQIIKLTLFFGLFLLLTSCAALSTSMTPSQVNQALPTLTKSKYLTQVQAEEAIKTNSCKYLVRGREYTAPIGMTVNNDLKNGAKGIDEWVKLDGGNAYVLISYSWETVDDLGSTQLKLKFDTMLCE
jgi:hypothetical protein